MRQADEYHHLQGTGEDAEVFISTLSSCRRQDLLRLQYTAGAWSFPVSIVVAHIAEVPYSYTPVHHQQGSS
jgi:hypothetical protein